MPLRDPVFNPPFNIVRASHVELGVADVARSRAFYVDCLGYIVSDEDGRSYVLGINGAVDFNDSYGKEIFADVATALLDRAASRAAGDSASAPVAPRREARARRAQQ